MIQPNDMSKNIHPIEDHIETILLTISQNPVTNLVSLSGTGKTTILPMDMAKAGNRVYVVVSDDAIAKSLNEYVKTKSIKNTKTINTNENVTLTNLHVYVSSNFMKKQM